MTTRLQPHWIGPLAARVVEKLVEFWKCDEGKTFGSRGAGQATRGSPTARPIRSRSRPAPLPPTSRAQNEKRDAAEGGYCSAPPPTPADAGAGTSAGVLGDAKPRYGNSNEGADAAEEGHSIRLAQPAARLRGGANPTPRDLGGEEEPGIEKS
jgi:hypothetical protein